MFCLFCKLKIMLIFFFEKIFRDELVVRGSSQALEKRYLRLTMAPDPTTVRVCFVLFLDFLKKTDNTNLFFIL